MDIEKIKELAAQIVEEMDDSVQFNILAQDDFTLEIEDNDDFTNKDIKQLHEEVRALLKPRCYLRCDNWHLLSYDYLLFADLDDDDALADNIEAFEVPTPWLIRADKKSYSLIGEEPLGVMFLKVPKWAADDFEIAMDNYLKRMEWKHHGFTQLACEVLADLCNRTE